MQHINSLSLLVITLIRAGAAFRVVFCLIRMMTSEDEMPQMRKRIRNAILFYIIAESAFLLKDLMIQYYT